MAVQKTKKSSQTKKSSREMTVHISPKSVLKAVGILLGVALFFKIWKIIVGLFIAMVIAAALEPTLVWLEKRSIPRIASVPSIFLLAVGTLVAIFYAILPGLFNEVFILSKDLPQQYGDLFKDAIQESGLSEVGFLVPALDELLVNLQDRIGEIVPSLFGFISAIFGGVFQFVLILVFSFYLSLRKRDIENSIIALTPEHNKEYMQDLIRRIQRRVGRWLQGMFALSTFMGLSVFIALSLLGVKFALTLAILAAFLEIIYYVGPFIAGGLIFLMASTQSLGLGLIAVGVYTLLQQLDQAFVVPTVMSRVVGYNPLYLLLAILIGAELAGFLGIIAAVPAVATLGEIFRGVSQKIR